MWCRTLASSGTLMKPLPNVPIATCRTLTHHQHGRFEEFAEFHIPPLEVKRTVGLKDSSLGTTLFGGRRKALERSLNQVHRITESQPIHEVRYRDGCRAATDSEAGVLVLGKPSSARAEAPIFSPIEPEQ